LWTEGGSTELDPRASWRVYISFHVGSQHGPFLVEGVYISRRRTMSSFRTPFSFVVGAIVWKHHFWYFDVFSMLRNTTKD
jgi:hypothetical protein